MEELAKLRKKIDATDSQLLHVLKERLKVVAQIGRLKKKLGLSPLQPERWNSVVSSRLTAAEKLGLNKMFIHKLFHLIHEESLKKQHGLLKKVARQDKSDKT